MRYILASAACSIALALASHADAADTPYKRPIKVLPKTVFTTPGSDRMLNPQPLPPRWLSNVNVNPLLRVGLNPQPLPPGPPDPDSLRKLNGVRLIR